MLATLGITPEGADDILEDLGKNRKERRLAKGVCMCGHSHNRHKRTSQGNMICQVNARYCHCHRFRPVLVADSLLPFVRVSEGNGPKHALFRGLVALMEQGGTFTWNDGAYICASCGVTDEVYPVIIDNDGRPALPSKDTLFDRYDILLCGECDKTLQTTGRMPSNE
jgi:hypothetical protein